MGGRGRRKGGREGGRGKEKEKQLLFNSQDIGLDVGNTARLVWLGRAVSSTQLPGISVCHAPSDRVARNTAAGAATQDPAPPLRGSEQRKDRKPHGRPPPAQQTITRPQYFGVYFCNNCVDYFSGALPSCRLAPRLGRPENKPCLIIINVMIRQ